MSYDGINSTNEIDDEVEINEKSANLGAAIVLVTIGVLGTFMNLTVIFVILKDRKTLLTPMNVILLNLVVSDELSRREYREIKSIISNRLSRISY